MGTENIPLARSPAAITVLDFAQEVAEKSDRANERVATVMDSIAGESTAQAEISPDNVRTIYSCLLAICSNLESIANNTERFKIERKN